ncbi:MAG TPA: trypsin-like peptidase domain-containing protein, partial [Verrucomicrobiae bacterium]|nr:trypsin-like peptidase domain-containing protein [Verrucomicrobiae bacterium]
MGSIWLRADDAEPVSTTRTAQQIMEMARDAVVVIKQGGRDGVHDGIGTGFVISEDGLIATSLHVIGEGRPLTVWFANGKSAAVKEIHAWDRKLDLAVIRVDAKDLPYVRLGNSENLKQGAPVVAIGNPQGLTHSVVQGLVSALRDFESGPMIQLAIPIEPGNSGGPLLDMKGKVQGILEMKSLVTENLGFAIPINAIKPLIENPNTVPFDRWLAIGSLNPKVWKPIMGAQWRQKAGVITVDGSGEGFGGRSLCLSQQEVPAVPYEIAVSVQLEDESGAAGLAFASGGGDEHYGFYPSGGQLRLTRFDGPTVFTWNILRQIDSAHYHPGEWNRLKVRVEAEKIICS